MNEITPGPWRFTEGGCIVDAGGRTLAYLAAAHEDSLKNGPALAALPELLEALRLVTDALNDPGVGDIEQWKRDCKLGTSKARAAIAKATGAQP